MNIISVLREPKEWYEFESSFSYKGFPLKASFTEDQIKNEPMFFNSSISFAKENAGPITYFLLTNLPRDWYSEDIVLDSRVHMLMPGFYPCIPGFHHDFVPRTDRMNGQPDYEDMDYKSEHLQILINGDISPTEFIEGKVILPKLSKDHIIYREWDDLLTKYPHTYINSLDDVWRESNIYKIESNRWVQFNWESFHRGTPAIKSGWRFFMRLSRNTDRTKNITNEIRKQVQVYIDPINKGW